MNDKPPPPATLLGGPVAEDAIPRAPRVVAGIIGVSADQLALALRWAGIVGHVTAAEARRVMRAWHDRPVMPIRRGSHLR